MSGLEFIVKSESEECMEKFPGLPSVAKTETSSSATNCLILFFKKKKKIIYNIFNRKIIHGLNNNVKLEYLEVGTEIGLGFKEGTFTPGIKVGTFDTFMAFVWSPL